MKKKKNNICLDNKAMEDFIWMSYRYCIGRKTIAAATHADTIREFINNNPNIISEGRKEFMANDIRREINHIINWCENVNIEGTKDIDTYSMLLYASNNYKNEKNKSFIYNVDTYKEIVEVEETDKEIKDYMSFEHLYIDIVPWIRLANILDKKTHKKVTVFYDGKENEYIAYPYPIKNENGDYCEVYCELNTSCSITCYLSPEFITKIEKL